MSNTKQYPIVEGLFTGVGREANLIAGKCDSCGTYCFPKSSNVHSPDCKQRATKEVLLSRKGKLDSYTVQYYPPPPPFVSPDPFVPYAIGLVELPEGISVVSILADCTPEKLQTGIDMELVVEKLHEDADGNEALSWKFRPV